LDDLHDGDVALPPDADAARALEVVPVHDDVHHQVQRDGHPRDGRVADELGVAEQGRGAVVVRVEEGCKSISISTAPSSVNRTQRLLLQEQEDGVQQLEVLSHVIQLRPSARSCLRGGKTHIVENDQMVRPPAIDVANAVKDAIPHHRRNQLLQEQQQQRAADESQQQVVQHEDAVELEGLAPAHHLAAAEDEHVVADERGGGGAEGGHGRAAGHEAEVLRQVAHDGGEGALEERVHGEAEGVVERRGAEGDGREGEWGGHGVVVWSYGVVGGDVGLRRRGGWAGKAAERSGRGEMERSREGRGGRIARLFRRFAMSSESWGKQNGRSGRTRARDSARQRRQLSY
jgi:hypothetical protein